MLVLTRTEANETALIVVHPIALLLFLASNVSKVVQGSRNVVTVLFVAWLLAPPPSVGLL